MMYALFGLAALLAMGLAVFAGERQESRPIYATLRGNGTEYYLRDCVNIGGRAIGDIPLFMRHQDHTYYEQNNIAFLQIYVAGDGFYLRSAIPIDMGKRWEKQLPDYRITVSRDGVETVIEDDSTDRLLERRSWKLASRDVIRLYYYREVFEFVVG